MSDTRDLVQDAAMGTWRRLDHVDLNQRGDLEAYVRQAVLNRIRDEARRLDRRPAPEAIDSSLPGTAPSPFEQALGRETSARYHAAFSRLSADEREILIARLEFGYSYQEVSELFHKPSADAARMATVRALDHLKALMERGDR
jgi:RNA polymerase sigma-70 factor (ECF subfamily)